MLLRRCSIALLAVLATAPLSRPQSPEAPDRTPSGALVVPIDGIVSFRTVALVRRGLATARSEGVARVILDINTPGGEIQSMEEVVATLNLLRDDGTETIAYVRRQALSAGAVIALACKRIFMAEGATIGAAVPVFAGGMRGVIEDEVRAKYISAFRADVRAIAEAAHNKDQSIALLAEAMVDERLEIVKVSHRGEDGVMRPGEIMTRQGLEALRSKPGVTILSEEAFTNRPLTLTTKQAFEVKFCEIANSLDDLLRELAVGPKEWKPLEPTWSEELASFLHGIRMFLLIGGVLMAVIAFKAPGTGVPEALAAVCFLAFFAGSWLVGLAEITEVLLFVFGIGLVLVEIFVIPGTIVSGLVGFLMVVSALFLSLQPFVLPGSGMEGDVMEANLWSLVIAIVIVVACAVALSRLLPRLPLFHTLLLEGGDRSLENLATTEREHSPLVGRTGTALTDLRPAGKAQIDGDPIDVVAVGTFIEKGSDLRVVKVEGNRIAVESVSAPSEVGQISVPWLVFMLFVGAITAVLEVFFPTGGILGIVSAVLWVGSVFLAFQWGTDVGVIFLAAVLVLAPTVVFFAFRMLDKSRFGRRIILAGPTFDPDDHSVHGNELDAFVGKSGTAVTPLRPSGTVEIDGRRHDAMTRGESLEPGQRVRVVKVELAQLVVTADLANPSDTTTSDS